MRLLVTFLCFASALRAQTPVYTVAAEPRNPVDERLFGAFFEKATWGGEIGADAAASTRTGELIPEVLAYMRWMDIPTLRFPGGTAVDYYPWWRLIDSMPGEHARRPRNAHYEPEERGRPGVVSSDGRVGLHEFVDLCRELGAEPLLVVNIGDAYFGERPLAEAAERLGGDFVRYCNDAEGPWAELRAANGHAAPFGVRLWQIGNETWGFDGWEEPEDGARLAETVVAYASEMRAAAPDMALELIADGTRELAGTLPPDIVDYRTFHVYTPWGIGAVLRDGEPVDSAGASAAEVWRALASAPDVDSATGNSVLREYTLDSVAGPLALTEWNLNGWFRGEAKWAEPDNAYLAYGLGAASILHAILRASDRVRLAHQSMLVGTSWGITGIRVDTTEAKRPVMFPSGMVTGLYSRYHGDQYHEVTGEHVRTFAQPLRLIDLHPMRRVAEQDVVVTANEEYFYVHVLNRAFAGEQVIRVAFPEPVAAGTARLFALTEAAAGEKSPYAGVEERAVGGGGERFRKTVEVAVPARSVGVVRVGR